MTRENKNNRASEEAPARVRRLHGAGGIDQLPSGRWRVRVRLPSGARVTEVVDTEHEANVLRAALVVERREMAKRGELDAPGRMKAPEPITLGERALDVLEGGPMRLRHAVDLAGLVLDAGEAKGDVG